MVEFLVCCLLSTEEFDWKFAQWDTVNQTVNGVFHLCRSTVSSLDSISEDFSEDVSESGSFFAFVGEEWVFGGRFAVVVAGVWLALGRVFAEVVLTRRRALLPQTLVAEVVRAVWYTVSGAAAEVVDW